MMTSHDDRKSPASLSFAAKAVGYVAFQMILLLTVSLLPWPVVSYHTVSTMEASKIPAPVFLLFWNQSVIGLFLPLRGKLFLVGQYILFAFLFFVLCVVEDGRTTGTRAVISPLANNLYWAQFIATALGCLSFSFKQSKVRAWYPLLTYLVIQLAILWVISHGRWPLVGGRASILLIYWIQFFGLLFASNLIKFFACAEFLLGLSLSQLVYWLPTGSYSPHSSTSTWFWVGFLTQGIFLSWWLFLRSSGYPVRHETIIRIPNRRDTTAEEYRVTESAAPKFWDEMANWIALAFYKRGADVIDTKTLYLLACVVWPLLPVTAAALRMVSRRVIAPLFGEQTSYVVFSLLLVAGWLSMMWVFVNRIKGSNRPRDLWFIGMLWTAMTIGYEFGYFHYIPGLSWTQRPLVDFFPGRNWVLLILFLTTLCGPFLIDRRQSSLMSNVGPSKQI